MRFLLTACCILIASRVSSEERVTVFAAASLTNAVGDLAKSYEAKTGVKVVTSYAASSTLAKQIENGAPADLFFSADVKWMDYLQERKHVDPAGRVETLGNVLVIIAPKDKPFTVRAERGFDLAGAFAGRLAIGDPGSVPVGMYGKEAFTNLGWWTALEPRLAPTADVRAALRLVETAEVDAGVVYATDAAQSTRVVVVATIPGQLHTPIRYPLARTTHAGPAAAGLLAYLSGPEAAVVYVRYGFTVLTKPATSVP